MIGLTDVQNVCHEAEDLFKEEGGQPDSADMVLKVKDWIEAATQQAGNLVTAGTAGK
jgi:HPt (histidine-containing phosphotransfer) domain-containing protein